jgi:hypothetical protein
MPLHVLEVMHPVLGRVGERALDPAGLGLKLVLRASMSS